MITAQDPNLGDPSLLASYPACAAQCQILVINRPSNPCGFTTSNNLTCQCDFGNRAATAACEKVTCSPTDYDNTQTLAQELCGPLYTNGTLNPTSVTSAIASATAAASAAVEGKDVTDPNDYPDCATACQEQNLPASGCGSLANTSCACNSPAIVTTTGQCEQQTCSPEDLRATMFLAYRLCAGVGGPGNTSEVANQTIATQTAGSVPLPPTGVPGGVVPFTGGVVGKGVELGGWIVLMGAFVLSWMVV
ncbi:MAG: hypothetical protein Q9205_007703 [Flavoplaca limonia]